MSGGDEPDTWIVVEHDPVITLGRNAAPGNVLRSAESLARDGIEVVPIERGGDATYHGPGQLVVYPIVKLARFREVVPFVSGLEAAAIATAARFGVDARTRREHRGIYVGNAALGAVGLAVKGMTTMHGLALNVSTTLDYDRYITPCGAPEFGITSLSHELRRSVELAEVREALVTAIARGFALRFDRAVCQGAT